MVSFKVGNKLRVSIHITCFQPCSRCPSQYKKKQEKKVQIGKKEEKLSLCIEDKFFVEYPKEFAHTHNTHTTKI